MQNLPPARTRDGKYTRPDQGREKNPALLRFGVTMAIFSMFIAVYLHLIPRGEFSFNGFHALAAIQLHTPLAYYLLAGGIFVAASLLKIGLKSPHILDPKYWPYIWWATIFLDTAFDLIYVTTIFFGRWDLFLGTLGAMIAIDGIILSERYNNAVAHIIAQDVLEGFSFAGLTLLFTNLVSLH